MKDRRIFKLYWQDGKTEEIYGSSIFDAVEKAGYGGGALAALDYWEEI